MDYTDLKKLAQHFRKKIFDNTYIIIAGRKNRATKFEIKFYEDEFSHFTGLEHIPVIDSRIQREETNKKTGRRIGKRQLRSELYKDIYKGNFKEDVSDLIAIPGTLNPITKSGTGFDIPSPLL